MNIDQSWLDDGQLARISRQRPSTEFGRSLFERWGERYPELLSSDIYRGCAIVLSMLTEECARRGHTITAIEQIIDEIHDCVRASGRLPAGTDLQAGATLSLSNAWQSAHSGVTASQAATAYESELIYVANLFLRARGQARP